MNFFDNVPGNLRQKLALRLVDLSITQDINKLIDLCKKTSFLELSFYLYYLHLTRAVHQESEKLDQSKFGKAKVATSLADESFKYLIQCVVKFGTLGLITEDNYRDLNLGLAQELLKIANKINTKFSSRGLLYLYEARINHGKIEINLSSPLPDSENVRFQNYFSRKEISNEFQEIPETVSRLEYLIEEFLKSYVGTDDLFVAAFGVTLDTYVEFNKFLAEFVKNNLLQCEKEFPYISDGMIDVQNVKTLFLHTHSTYISLDEILNEFGEKILPLVEKLSFVPQKFDEHELRFHQIARTPLIKLSDKNFQLSPDLIFDSLFTNTHYSLLEESQAIKEKYKAQGSDNFLSKIAETCSISGYKEVSRNVSLRETGRDIGDIDLVLKNPDEQFLLIEAKNHMLPLAVYFYDFDATKEHLTYLKDYWERPFLNRDKHLKLHSTEYGIPTSYEYIVVSRMPEVISHFSDCWFISIHELNTWLQNRGKYRRFLDMYKELYENAYKFSNDDIEILRKDGFIL